MARNVLKEILESWQRPSSQTSFTFMAAATTFARLNYIKAGRKIIPFHMCASVWCVCVLKRCSQLTAWGSLFKRIFQQAQWPKLSKWQTNITMHNSCC